MRTLKEAESRMVVTTGWDSRVSEWWALTDRSVGAIRAAVLLHGNVTVG